MSLHVFANVVTPFGTAANNRGDNEGTNITPLQKLLWLGDTHTTVSAEAIRFALRRVLHGSEETNRVWDEAGRANVWQDDQFKGWATEKGHTFIDDDLLGFMTAEAAKEEGGKGSINARRAVLGSDTCRIAHAVGRGCHVQRRVARRNALRVEGGQEQEQEPRSLRYRVARHAVPIWCGPHAGAIAGQRPRGQGPVRPL